MRAKNDIMIVSNFGIPKPVKIPVAAIFDKLLGIAFIVFPFLSFGSYSNFMPFMIAIGAAYLAISYLLRSRSDKRTAAVAAAVIRVVFTALLTANFLIISNRLENVKAIYPIQKAAYIRGNYSGADFDFLPQRIPENTKDFKMFFRPPMIAQADTKEIIICFTADENGTKDVLTFALEHGAVKAEAPETEIERMQDRGYDYSGADVYVINYDNTSHDPKYFINEQSGFCLIYW